MYDFLKKPLKFKKRSLQVSERFYSSLYPRFGIHFLQSLHRCEIGTYNLDHSILVLYNVLVQIRLTTSKTKRDI